MPLYFAFGSNMSSVRLRARVGEVEVLGKARLDAHRHAFDKLGADGTGKGNVFPVELQPPAEGDVVWGVAYRVTEPQLETLDRYEGGYRRTKAGIHIGTDQLSATTYVALKRHQGLRPTDAYLAHYLTGLREHGIDEEYVQRLLASVPR